MVDGLPYTRIKRQVPFGPPSCKAVEDPVRDEFGGVVDHIGPRPADTVQPVAALDDIETRLIQEPGEPASGRRKLSGQIGIPERPLRESQIRSYDEKQAAEFQAAHPGQWGVLLRVVYESHAIEG